MNILKGIVYTEFDIKLGPSAVCWLALELPIETINLISLKSLTFLAAEQGLTPSSLVFIPFPSLKLKAIIKFIDIKKKDHNVSGTQSAITLVFKEEDDAIFYRYMKDLEEHFNAAANKIIELESTGRDEEKILDEIKILQNQILNVLSDLRKQEDANKMSEAFPEIKTSSGYQFKIIICGEPQVGKTSIILRFTESAFNRTYIPTLGVNMSEKTVTINDFPLHLIFWDIAGQSKFDTLRKHFYEGADGLLLVFDLTNPDSISNIDRWYKDVNKYSGRKFSLKGFVIGNKKDLVEKRKILKETANKRATELKLNYIETSALTGENIKQVFYQIAKELLLIKGNLEIK